VRPVLYRNNQPIDIHPPLIGLDLSVMAHGVYNKAIIDIVSPDSLASQPYLLKDLQVPILIPLQTANAVLSHPPRLRCTCAP
jgi:hypothetical protein